MRTRLSKWLNWRQITLLAVTVFFAPFWILNYENLLSAVGLHKILLDDQGRPVMGFATILDFITSDPVKWFIIGGLVVAFLPMAGRLVRYIFVLVSSIAIRVKGGQSRKITIAHEGINLSLEVLDYCGQVRAKFDAIRFVRGDNNADADQAAWGEYAERTLKISSEFRSDVLSRFGGRMGHIIYELSAFGYLNKDDTIGWETNPVAAERTVVEMQTASRRLLHDLGIDARNS